MVKTAQPAQVGVVARKSESRPSTPLLIGGVLLLQVIGSLGYPISVHGLRQIEPFTFAFHRFVLGSVVILAAQWFFGSRTPPIERRDWPRIVLLGILIIPLNQLLFLVGQSMTAAGHAAVLFSTTPLWIMILSVLLLRERLGTRQVIGTAGAILGVGIIMTGGTMQVGREYLLGDLILVGSVTAWVFYTVLGKPMALKYGAFRMTAYALGIGTFFYLPFGLPSALQFDYGSASASAWGAVAYMAILMSIVGYVIWYWVLKHMPASRVALYYNLQPIIATTVAYIMLGERVGVPFLVGASVVLAGVLLAETGSERSCARHPAPSAGVTPNRL